MKPNTRQSSSTRRQGSRSNRSHQAGFTLIEVITVTTVFAMLVGMGIPIAELYVRQKMLESEREEMQMLGEAYMNFYADVEAFPGALVDLVDPDPVPEGWLGPYVGGNFDDDDDNSDDYRFDIWRNAYEIVVVDATHQQILSYGANGTDEAGAGDDIVYEVDSGPAMAKITRREIGIINNAVATYNADFVFSNPLSTDYATLLGQLQAAGYVPTDGVSTARYLTDAWGQTYVTSGQTPVLEVLTIGAP